ncbi:MAG: hypothetical protein QOD82_6407 [Pseudonocardiales bacterium]|nr:hypothetical protein [Pseudonocardiales bacterium]
MDSPRVVLISFDLLTSSTKTPAEPVPSSKPGSTGASIRKALTSVTFAHFDIGRRR